mgnify:CR=1 FL=1
MAMILYSKLPKEIVYLIFEFNPEHREKFYHVIHDIHFRIVKQNIIHIGCHIDCYECGIEVHKDDAYVSSCFGYIGYYCSGYCEWSSEYDMRKSYRKQSRLANA